MVLNTSHQAYDNAPSAPIYSRNTFASCKYLNAEGDGYQHIDQYTKLEGKDVRHDGVYYNPPAPAEATAG